ncbi:MAG: ABC transporter permease [Candidatus Obscuribacterales bacterium]|nr:ABC transporter permease [Candidatus Obscuribacterales bacterium]
MQKVLKLLPGFDLPLWLAPLGLSVRLFLNAVSVDAFNRLRKAEFLKYCQWMGEKGFHLVALAAVFVSIALTIECVIEMQKYRAQDLSGAIISIGLLREIGPMTVSLAWCARVSAMLANEVRYYASDDIENFGKNFICPRYLATLTMAIPLGAYGLVFGFITGALVAPLLGVSSTNDFLESARRGIEDKDLVVYFLKLILINPTIGVFAGCAAGWYGRGNRGISVPVEANAVTATLLVGYIANLIVTYAAYLD